MCVCLSLPLLQWSLGTLLMEVPGTPIRASFLEFELKPTSTGKDSRAVHTDFDMGDRSDGGGLVRDS